MYALHYSNNAKRALKNLDHQVGKRIYQALESIRENPRSHIEEMKRPKGAEPLYKYRVGEHRVIMALFATELVFWSLISAPEDRFIRSTVERDNPDLRTSFSHQV